MDGFVKICAFLGTVKIVGAFDKLLPTSEHAI